MPSAPKRKTPAATKNVAAPPKKQKKAKAAPKINFKLTPEELKNQTEQGVYISSGGANLLAMRRFVKTVRKNPELAKQFVVDGNVSIRGSDGATVLMPINDRHSSRTPGEAMNRARRIVEGIKKLTKGTAKNGRYVSLLRDFGFGGQTTQKLVGALRAEGMIGPTVAPAIVEKVKVKEEEEEEEKEEALDTLPLPLKLTPAASQCGFPEDEGIRAATPEEIASFEL
jgi:hypothetical protein